MTNALQIKIIDGKKCTTFWYVDGNKVSHVNLKVNIMIIKTTANMFGDLIITRGKNEKNLDMDIELLDDNKLAIGMKGYIQEAI